jgi:hypothetical protein
MPGIGRDTGGSAAATGSGAGTAASTGLGVTISSDLVGGLAWRAGAGAVWGEAAFGGTAFAAAATLATGEALDTGLVFAAGLALVGTAATKVLAGGRFAACAGFTGAGGAAATGRLAPRPVARALIDVSDAFISSLAIALRHASPSRGTAGHPRRQRGPCYTRVWFRIM